MEDKKAMMQLWKDTFHDSDEYIRLVFDNYYDPELCLTHKVDGRVVAALMGVPYFFRNAKSNISMRALYLCGLSTDPAYRRHGIMAQLMDKIAAIAKKKGFAMLFLIPANDGLRKYYRDRGYADNFYQRIDHYTAGHTFYKMSDATMFNKDGDCVHISNQNDEYMIVKKITKVILGSNENLRDKIIHYLISNSRNEMVQNITHTFRDWSVVLDEALLSDNDVYYMQTSQEKLCGVVFTKIAEDGSLFIPFLVAESDCFNNRLMQALVYLYPQRSISVVVRNPKKIIAQTEETLYFDEEYKDGRERESGGDGTTYLRGVPETVDANRLYRPYGMLRIVDNYEILKFLSDGLNDLKYSILVKEKNLEGKWMKYKCELGVFTREEVEVSKDYSGVVMDGHDLEEFLCRAPHDADYVKDAFGLPRLDLEVMLLLE